MPGAQPLPRKHLTTIRDATETLKAMANRIARMLEMLDEGERPSANHTRATLQSLQSTCYSVALSLSEVDIADNCDTCSLAPPKTSAELQLTILSNKLRTLANETRFMVRASESCEISADQPH